MRTWLATFARVASTIVVAAFLLSIGDAHRALAQTTNISGMTADIKSQNFDGMPKEEFETYIKKTQLPKLTKPTKLDSLPLARKRYHGATLFPYDTKGEVHDLLNTWTLDAMMEVITGEIKPPTSYKGAPEIWERAVKVNAALLIGELNEDEGASTLKPPPTPLPQAVEFLKTAVQPDDKGQPAYGVAVQLAALTGLRRAADLGRFHPPQKGAQKEARTAVCKTLLAIVKQKTPPASMDDSQHGWSWMRERAAETLVLYNDPELLDENVAAISELIADKNAWLNSRARAVILLSDLKYPADNKVDFAALGKLASDLSNDVVQAGIDSLMLGIEPSKWQQLKDQLGWLRQGLTGDTVTKKTGLLGAASSAEQKTAITAADEYVQHYITAAAGKTISGLRAALPSATPPPAAAPVVKDKEAAPPAAKADQADASAAK